MKTRNRFLSVVCALALVVSTQASPGVGQVQTYRCLCDASAVVMLDERFFVVADDEDNILRMYDVGAVGRPVATFDLTRFLRVDSNSPESDLEGATRVGNRIYWITSHGRNRKGKERPSRQRFFATDITGANGIPALSPAGIPYTTLLNDLLADPKLARFNFADAAVRAPKAEDALNIEGLAAAPDGTLLIGFRNPVPDGKALLLPLLNPDELIIGKRARFGEPLLLDLEGLGIRSIERSADRYFIVAGARDGSGQSRLFTWDGATEKPAPMNDLSLAGLNPEALFPIAGNNGEQLLITSDDGTVKIGKRECKKLKNVNQKQFRAVRVQVN